MKGLTRQVAKLKRQINKAEQEKQTWNYGNKIEVDYFALMDLIRFFDETKVKMNRVLIARDLLEHVHWQLRPMDIGETIDDSRPRT